ncbi:sodium/proton-translocating pyrophosphatase, partial [Candidatus Bathyarchaeota archaeon]|nr:sodium/proton-translocating pyrophosphatase [Candidatus Bathyarchaeota archaeon]
MDLFEPWYIAPISALISILMGLYLYHYINKQDSGTKKMQEISSAIREGANAFLRREYTILAVFVFAVAILLGIFLPEPIWTSQNLTQNLSRSIAYIFGAFCSALAGFFGMDVATRANAKAANGAREGLNKAFTIGFRGGAVMG